jgi:hypothetical protein
MAGPLYSFTSSIASDSIDHPPSDCFSFTPSEAAESQTSIHILCDPPPPSIKRVGPDQDKIWALWSDIYKAEFIQWWLTTTYGMKPKRERPHWDKRGYSSELWRSFDQVAHVETGYPKAMCIVCGELVDHPIIPGGPRRTKPGTNALKRHVERQCRGAPNGVKSLNLPDLWKKAVSAD